MADLSFYNNPDLADGFGATAGRRRPHGGLDFPHGNGTPIPALFSGVVAEKGISSELGAYTQIRSADGKVFTYCHSQEPSPLAVGASVAQGDIVNLVGERGYATGPHLHIAVGNSLAVGYDVCEDPWPWVQRALAGEDISGGSASQPAEVSGNLRQVQGDGVTYFEPVGDLAVRIGNALAARGRVDDPFANDGDPGSNWRKGVQRTLINAGLWSGEPDGVLGPNNLDGVQEYAKKFGDYTGPVDTDPREFSWNGFALGLERP